LSQVTEKEWNWTCAIAPIPSTTRSVRKMIAQMTLDQRAAMRVFSHMGFEREARLRNQLVDRDGQFHDLQIMSLDVDEFRARVDLMAISAQHEYV
jgi:hypothetical protein